MKSKLAAVLLICLSLIATDACAGKTTAEKAKPGKAVSTQQQPVSSISKILTPYIAIWKMLKNNTITGVPENAEALIEAAKSEIAGAVKTKKSDEYKSSLETIIKAAQLLDDKQADIRKTRIAFGTLGDLIVDFTGANFSDEDMKDYKSYYCGLSKHYWIQPASEKMRNPFFGKEAPDCGDQAPAPAKPGRDAFLKCEPRSQK